MCGPVEKVGKLSGGQTHLKETDMAAARGADVAGALTPEENNSISSVI